MSYFARHLTNIILFLLPPTRLFKVRSYLLSLSGISIQGGAMVCGRSWIYGRGRIYIGHGTWISPGIVVHTHTDADIRIGDRCDIGPGVEFIPGGHLVGPHSRRAGDGTARPIEIGDGCWIGARSVILGGVRIGAGCVVAAGSVVTRDVPDNVLVAGVPARIKRQLDGEPSE